MDTFSTTSADDAAGSAAARRRTRQRQETLRSILEATRALLDESESDDFSIRQLAERCGYTAPTIYKYFADKEALIDALIEERFASLVDDVQAMATENTDPLALLRAHTLLFVRFATENRSFYRLLLGRRQRVGDSRPPPRSAERVRVLMQKPMEEIAAQGRLQVEVEVAHQSMWALTHGLTTLLVNRPELDWNPALVESAIDAMLRGLVASASEPLPAPPENER